MEEWRALEAQATVELYLVWLDRYQEVVSAAQAKLGEPNHYRRRRAADKQLDPERSLAEQFNPLRVKNIHFIQPSSTWVARALT